MAPIGPVPLTFERFVATCPDTPQPNVQEALRHELAVTCFTRHLLNRDKVQCAHALKGIRTALDKAPRVAKSRADVVIADQIKRAFLKYLDEKFSVYFDETRIHPHRAARDAPDITAMAKNPLPDRFNTLERAIVQDLDDWEVNKKKGKDNYDNKCRDWQDFFYKTGANGLAPLIVGTVRNDPIPQEWWDYKEMFAVRCNFYDKRHAMQLECTTERELTLVREMFHMVKRAIEYPEFFAHMLHIERYAIMSDSMREYCHEAIQLHAAAARVGSAHNAPVLAQLASKFQADIIDHCFGSHFDTEVTLHHPLWWYLAVQGGHYNAMTPQNNPGIKNHLDGLLQASDAVSGSHKRLCRSYERHHALVHGEGAYDASTLSKNVDKHHRALALHTAGQSQLQRQLAHIQNQHPALHEAYTSIHEQRTSLENREVEHVKAWRGPRPLPPLPYTDAHATVVRLKQDVTILEMQRWRQAGWILKQLRAWGEDEKVSVAGYLDHMKDTKRSRSHHSDYAEAMHGIFGNLMQAEEQYNGKWMSSAIKGDPVYLAYHQDLCIRRAHRHHEAREMSFELPPPRDKLFGALDRRGQSLGP